MRRIHADILLLMTAAIWGLAFVFQKSAMDNVGPLTFIAARCLLAAVALVPFVVYEGRRAGPPGGRNFAAVVITSGILFFLGADLQQRGLITATVTNTGFLTALYIIFVPLIAWAWHRISPSPIIWPAAGVSFVGTWLLSGGTFNALSAGDLLVMISAVFWAAHVVSTGIASRSGRPVLFSCLQFVIVTAMAGAGALLFEAPTLEALYAARHAIAYVGLLSTALTFTILTVAMRHTPPSEASIIVSTESLFAAVAGALLLGERLSAIAVVGAALIVAATLAIQVLPDWGKKRAAQTPS